MPEEMSMTTPEVNEVNNESINTEVQETTDVSSSELQNNSTPQETEQEQIQAFKVKHLHEEKEIPYDEAPTYIQKGLDYDRVKSKYEESKPALGLVEKLAKQNGMTIPEYVKAVEEYERQQEIEKLSEQNSLPPELAEEIYLSRQERQQRQVQEQQKQVEQKQQQEFMNFINEFPEVKPQDIPSEVWDIKAKNPNTSITDAYIRHQYNQIQGKLKAQETNKENAMASTGSTTGNGNSKNSILTPESIEHMSESEIAKRWNEVKKVMGMK